MRVILLLANTKQQQKISNSNITDTHLITQQKKIGFFTPFQTFQTRWLLRVCYTHACYSKMTKKKKNEKKNKLMYLQ